MNETKGNGAPRQESAAQISTSTHTHGNAEACQFPMQWTTAPLIVVPTVLLNELIEREVARRVKDAAVAWSNALDWSKAASTPSYVELRRRRYDYGPLRPPIDRAALTRWVKTGSSEEVPA